MKIPKTQPNFHELNWVKHLKAITENRNTKSKNKPNSTLTARKSSNPLQIFLTGHNSSIKMTMQHYLEYILKEPSFVGKQYDTQFTLYKPKRENTNSLPTIKIPTLCNSHQTTIHSNNQQMKQIQPITHNEEKEQILQD